MSRFLYSSTVSVSGLFLATSAFGQCQTELLQPAPPMAAHTLFGVTLDVEGNRAAVGASGLGDHGSVMIYERGAMGWQYQWTIDCGAITNDGIFGNRAVELSGDTLAISSFPLDTNVDTVLLYQRDPATNAWSFSQALQCPSPHTYPGFGEVAELEGDLLVVGAPFDYDPNGPSGRVYVYRRQAGLWNLVQTLAPPVPDCSRFGERLALDGDQLLVHMPWYGGDYRGVVQRFEWVNGAFVAREITFSPNDQSFGMFGRGLALDGGIAVIGASDEDGFQGNAYVFDVTPNGLVFRQQLAEESNGSKFEFGEGVEIEGSRILVADIGGFVSYSRGVHVYDLESGSFVLKTVLKHPSGTTPDSFGTFGLKIENGEILIGSAFEPQLGVQNVGAVHIFEFQHSSYGSGCANGLGLTPRFDLDGCAIPGTKLGFEIENAHGGANAFVAIGFGQAQIPMGGGCALLVAPMLPSMIGPIPLFGTGPGNGFISAGNEVPNGLVPMDLYLQAFCSDPNAVLGFTATNGVKLTIE